MEHQHSHRYRKSKNMAGKLITILQLILSAALLILVWNSGMVPNLYLALMGAGLFLLFAITFFLQYIRNGVRYLGIVISLLTASGWRSGSSHSCVSRKPWKRWAEPPTRPTT